MRKHTAGLYFSEFPTNVTDVVSSHVASPVSCKNQCTFSQAYLARLSSCSLGERSIQQYQCVFVLFSFASLPRDRWTSERVSTAVHYVVKVTIVAGEQTACPEAMCTSNSELKRKSKLDRAHPIQPSSNNASRTSSASHAPGISRVHTERLLETS